MAYYDIIESPLGPIFVGGSSEGLHRVDFMTEARSTDWFVSHLEHDAGEPATRDPHAAAEAARQLREYMAGSRIEFELPLAARGTDWQRSVWAALTEIPAGETRTYGEIAARLDRPTSSRAVGAANRQNPLAIIVPCHRVVGADGTLTGYASGLDRKRWLLEHEAQAMPIFASATR